MDTGESARDTESADAGEAGANAGESADAGERADGGDREELNRQVRGHYGNWRDQPKGLACAVVAAFCLLTTLAFGAVVLAIVLAVTR
ncbi:hypothetical protein [Actinomadura gamaensis]|uniref:Uncharacterized protein n=1 Tax=Actinomadura gamaensis TaxID=1763541 RepID=A0ABV9U406_9ACTN